MYTSSSYINKKHLYNYLCYPFWDLMVTTLYSHESLVSARVCWFQTHHSVIFWIPQSVHAFQHPFFFFLRFTFRNNKVLLHGQIIRIIANMFFRGRFTVSSIHLISLSLSCVYAIKKTSIKNKIIIVWIAKPTFYALSGRPVWKRLCHRFRRFSLYPNARQHVV